MVLETGVKGQPVFMKDIFIFSYDLKDFLRDHRMWKIRKI